VDPQLPVCSLTSLQLFAKPLPIADLLITKIGNSSQLSDGAAASLLMKRSTAEKLKLPILATFRAFSVVGVEPAIMGVGPAYHEKREGRERERANYFI
jgi:acetyl-CoA acetyltransferase